MKRPISTDKAPGAIGPYSQAVRVGDMLFVSGQLPLDPKTGKFPEGIEAQTRQSLTNVRSILEAAGGTMDSVVKTTVFLSDMNNFAAMNAVYTLSSPRDAIPRAAQSRSQESRRTPLSRSRSLLSFDRQKFSDGYICLRIFYIFRRKYMYAY